MNEIKMEWHWEWFANLAQAFVCFDHVFTRKRANQPSISAEMNEICCM